MLQHSQNRHCSSYKKECIFNEILIMGLCDIRLCILQPPALSHSVGLPQDPYSRHVVVVYSRKGIPMIFLGVRKSSWPISLLSWIYFGTVCRHHCDGGLKWSDKWLLMCAQWLGVRYTFLYSRGGRAFT